MIRLYTADALLENKKFAHLIEEYKKCNRMPNVNMEDFDLSLYTLFDEHVIGILKDRDDNYLGFFAVMIQCHLHTNSKVGVLDSLFVLPEYRKNNNAGVLLEMARKWTFEHGVKNLILTAPAGSRLEKVYSRLYKPFETWFVMEVKK